MKVFLITILMIALLTSKQVMSAPVSTPMPATHLYAACNESGVKEYARGFCDGAIDALYSSIQDWCVPANVTHGEVQAHIKSELLETTPSLAISAFEFVNRSVQKAWPCP